MAKTKTTRYDVAWPRAPRATRAPRLLRAPLTVVAPATATPSRAPRSERAGAQT